MPMCVCLQAHVHKCHSFQVAHLCTVFAYACAHSMWTCTSVQQQSKQQLKSGSAAREQERTYVSSVQRWWRRLEEEGGRTQRDRRQPWFGAEPEEGLRLMESGGTGERGREGEEERRRKFGN